MTNAVRNIPNALNEKGCQHSEYIYVGIFQNIEQRRVAYGKLVTRNKHFGPAPKINENNSNNQQEQRKKETKKQSAEVSSS